MMCETCLETAGTVGAADVRVESGLKLESTQSRDPDERSHG